MEDGNVPRDCKKASNWSHSGSSVWAALSLLYRDSAMRASCVSLDSNTSCLPPLDGWIVVGGLSIRNANY
jgi:hypothetical protein